MSNTVSTDALRREAWREELFEDVERDLYFNQNGMMGTGDNVIVQVMDDLKKAKGDTVTFGLTARLTGAGVSGDDELEGNEEAINAYSENVAISQKRFGVRLTGRLDEQKNSYNMRADAKDKLATRLKEFIERQIFLKMGGIGLATITDVAGSVVSADYAWSNTPDGVTDAITGAGYGARYLCADYTNGADGLGGTELITPALISRCKAKAVVSDPKVRSLRINGKNYLVMFVHPYQAYDLKTNATWAQAQREAENRGKENPIFTGALGIWDGVILHEHEYAPFLDISVVGYNFNAAAGGTQYGVDCFRALLCGRQAIGFAKCKDDGSGWAEKSFDYGNKQGFSTGLIGGIQKIVFNSKDYGVITLDTAGTSLV